MKKVLFIAMCMTVIMLTACAKETNENGVNEERNTSVDVQETRVTFADDLGREITVDNPKRVATLLGSFADMWVLAGTTWLPRSMQSAVRQEQFYTPFTCSARCPSLSAFATHSSNTSIT